MKKSTAGVVLLAILVAAIVASAGIQLWGPKASTPTPSQNNSVNRSVSFSESGLPSGTNWGVAFANAHNATVAPAGITFSVPNGVYQFQLDAVADWTGSPQTGSVTVTGQSASVSVAFARSGVPIQHVVEILLEDTEVGNAMNESGYLTYLDSGYGSASAFYAVCHGSLPDYVAMMGGRYVPCGNGSIGQLNNSDLPDLLETKGYTWAGYFEGMPVPCDGQDAAAYHTDHNPFLNFNDIAHDQSRCDAHLLNSESFNSSVVNGTLPNFSFYAPSIYDDCRPETSSIPVCASWLSAFLAPILNSTSPKVQNLVAHTVFFVTFDEGSTDKGYPTSGIVNPWCRNTTGESLAVCGGHIYFVAISPYSSRMSYSPNATDFSLESTVEWLFNLGSDGGYDSSSEFPPMSGLFSFSANS